MQAALQPMRVRTRRRPSGADFKAAEFALLFRRRPSCAFPKAAQHLR
jgi:hypothetical protein